MPVDQLLLAVLPALIPKVMDSIETLSNKVSTNEAEAGKKLKRLNMDLNIINEVVSLVSRRSLNRVDGIKFWADEANATIVQAEQLLQKLEDKTNSKRRRMFHLIHPYINGDDMNELDELLSSFDNVNRYSDTILKLIKANRTRTRDVLAVLLQRGINSLLGKHA